MRRVQGLSEQALEEVAGDAETRAAINEHLAWVGIYRGDLAFAAEHTTASMDRVRVIADPAIRAESLSTFGMVEFLLGRPAQDLMAEAVWLEDLATTGAQTTVFTASRTCHGLQLLWAGELDAAREVLHQELTGYERLGRYVVRDELLCYLAEAGCRAGTGRPPPGTPRRRTRRRGCADACGTRTSSTPAATGRCSGSSSSPCPTPPRRWNDSGRCWPSWTSWSPREPGIVPCLPDAIEALVSLGRLEEAEALLDRLERQGRTLDRPWATATAGRGRGLLDAARGDLPAARSALEQALVAHGRVPQPFELARTLPVQARWSAEPSRSEPPAPPWSGRSVSSRTSARRCGRSGPRTTSPVSAGDAAVRRAHPDRATDRPAGGEGKQNREVAEALFISVKTVEANLSRIFHKLGVRSRTELTRRIATTPAQRTTSTGADT